MDWARILAYMTGTVDQELLGRNEYLAAENRILKAQLKGRPDLSDAERGALGSQPPAAPRTSTQREFAGRSFPSAITSLQTLAGVDGAPEILLNSKGFSEVDQTTETEQTPIFGL
jgi:hypothetical protein